MNAHPGWLTPPGSPLKERATITLLGSPRTSCDGLTRRETLKVGALSLLGGFFNEPSLLALEKASGSRNRHGKRTDSTTRSR